MSYRCMISHVVGSPRLQSGQLLFSWCSRCGIGLIRRGDRWRPIPGGFRIVIGRMPAKASICTEPDQTGTGSTPVGNDTTNRLKFPAEQPALKLFRPGGDLLAVALRMLVWRLSYAATRWGKKIGAERSGPAHIIALPSRAPRQGNLK